MQAVLGLVEHDRLRPVDHLAGDLLAAMGRQAMHEDGIRLGARQQGAVDLVAFEQIVAALAVPVAHPDHALHKLGRELTSRDLRKHRHLVVRETGSRRDKRVQSIEVAQRWTVSSMPTLIGAATRGYGFAWLPEDKIREELASGALKVLPMRDGKERVAQCYLVFADRDAAGPGTLRLAQIIREEVPGPATTVIATVLFEGGMRYNKNVTTDTLDQFGNTNPVNLPTASGTPPEVKFTPEGKFVNQAGGTRIERHDPLLAAGGSLRDMTRVAGANPRIWVDIFIENAGAISESLGDFRRRIEQLESALAAGDAGYLARWIGEAAGNRRRMLESAYPDPDTLHQLRVHVPDRPGVWALGDCALIPDPSGKPYPPTAQHALREGRVLAHNIAAAIHGTRKKAFVFSTLGQLATIGRRTGVANVMGINFSGFIAWWLWRTIYLSKLPRAEKKLRVALDWTLDLLFSKDLVQFSTHRAPTISAPGALH